MAATTLGGAAKAKNFNAVRVGREPGIYSTCDECKIHTDGLKGA